MSEAWIPVVGMAIVAAIGVVGTVASQWIAASSSRAERESRERISREAVERERLDTERMRLEESTTSLRDLYQRFIDGAEQLIRDPPSGGVSGVPAHLATLAVEMGLQAEAWSLSSDAKQIATKAKEYDVDGSCNLSALEDAVRRFENLAQVDVQKSHDRATSIAAKGAALEVKNV